MATTTKGKPPNSNNKSTVKFILRALESRNYRLYFGGQAISRHKPDLNGICLRIGSGPGTPIGKENQPGLAECVH